MHHTSTILSNIHPISVIAMMVNCLKYIISSLALRSIGDCSGIQGKSKAKKFLFICAVSFMKFKKQGDYIHIYIKLLLLEAIFKIKFMIQLHEFRFMSKLGIMDFKILMSTVPDRPYRYSRGSQN